MVSLGRGQSRPFFLEIEMSPLKRRLVGKNTSARQFKRNSRRTKAANLGIVTRGGIRL